MVFHWGNILRFIKFGTIWYIKRNEKSKLEKGIISNRRVKYILSENLPLLLINKGHLNKVPGHQFTFIQPTVKNKSLNLCTFRRIFELM